MGHEETPDAQDTEMHAATPASENGTNRTPDVANVPEPETLSVEPTDTRAVALEIFKARAYEGESLRMGQVLRRVREALGLNIADISRKSLLRQDFLMWIERMEIGQIPKGYLTPYLRAYSAELGLPDKDVIAQYTHECGAVSEVKNSAPVPKIGEIAPPKPKWPLMAATAAVLTLLAGGAIGLTQLVKPAPELTPAPAIVAVNGARHSLFDDASDANRPLPTHLPLELVAARQGWLEVRGADGTIFRSRVMAAGENYFPRLDAGWTVSAKDGGAFEWRIGDAVIGPLGPEGSPVFSVSVDQKLAEAATMAAPTVAANGANKATR
ncbi:MAG: helix-turn-helix domain-containing protein [Hyphomonas sp.]|tara:strand:+ start:8194 stop:9168 length:975 start_codon:yes stop_codon:yes gene_type:complete